MGGDSDEGGDTATCDVCGAEKPAALVDRTTVATVAPTEAMICRACQHVQDHELPEDVCMQCGDAIGTGWHFEVEFPLGEAELPGFMSGTLCGDCAAWIACDVNYEAVENDDEANEEHLARLETEHELRQAVATE